MESSVLANFRRGDAGATREMYCAYGRFVYAVVHRVLGRDDLAEEATRRTFVQAWQAAAGLEIHHDPAPWIARIAKRTAIEIHRRETRAAPATRDPVTVSRDAAVDLPPVETLDAVWKIRRVIDMLPEAERTVLQLQHRDGMTESEIGARLDVPVDTVRSRSRRAHDELAKLLGHLRESAT